MDNSILYYGKQMEYVGQNIILASKSFPEIGSDISEKDIRKIKDNYNMALEGIEKLKKCQNILFSINVPEKVKEEHEKIIKMMQMYIEGTELMFRSINIDDENVDTQNLEHGFFLQTRGQEEVVRLCNIIVDKLR